MFCLCRGISCGKKDQTQRTWDNEQQLFLASTSSSVFDIFLISTAHHPFDYHSIFFFWCSILHLLRFLPPLPRLLLLLFFLGISPQPYGFQIYPMHYHCWHVLLCIHQHLFTTPYPIYFLRTSMPNYHDIESNLLICITIPANLSSLANVTKG